MGQKRAWRPRPPRIPEHERQRRIEQEYGEPFWDVVRGFARDGESRAATAEILGYPKNAFYALVQREDKRHWFKVGNETNGAERCREVHPGDPNVAERCRHINPCYRWYTLDGVRDTLTGHARRRGVSWGTAWWRYVHHRDKGPAYWFATKNHTPKKGPSPPNHPWRKQWTD